MIDRNAIEPGAQCRLLPKTVEMTERFEEHVVGCILRLRRISQDPQREIVNGLSVLYVYRTEFM